MYKVVAVLAILTTGYHIVNVHNQPAQSERIVVKDGWNIKVLNIEWMCQATTLGDSDLSGEGFGSVQVYLDPNLSRILIDSEAFVAAKDTIVDTLLQR